MVQLLTYILSFLVCDNLIFSNLRTLKLANCYDANEVGFPLCIHMNIKAFNREVGPNTGWLIHILFWQLPFSATTTALSELILNRRLVTREGKVHVF